MKEIIELEPLKFLQPGPDPMTALERKTFFEFYKKHKNRRLYGFFKDLKKSRINSHILSKFLQNRKSVKCLLLGCSHWANPIDIALFLKKYKKHLNVEVAALDVLPDALVEGIKRNVPFLPLLASAQNTPFLKGSFDILVADGLLNCCCFEQHEPIVKEMDRIAKRNAIILLGLTHSEKTMVVKWSKRPIVCYSRTIKSFKNIFHKYDFYIPDGSSITTPFVEGSGIVTDNCIARK